uniref:WEB family protein n=1 Tax=Quercus lobata TaxID=97700 RepID=A0A7N2L3A5_QUELO
MEPFSLPQSPTLDYSSSVDTSRPFRSVKEAVAIFGERLLLGEMYSPSPKPYNVNVGEMFSPSPKPYNVNVGEMFSPSPKPYNMSIVPNTTRNLVFSDDDDDDSPTRNLVFSDNKREDESLVLYTLKKLEAELEETKVELKLLKERESETEVALASLNAELHKNMSKLANAEAAAATNALIANRNREVREDQERKRELMIRMEDSNTLAHILSLREEGYFGGKVQEKKAMKKKPIIPLVGDLFSRKKRSSKTMQNPLYSSPNVYN